MDMQPSKIWIEQCAATPPGDVRDTSGRPAKAVRLVSVVEKPDRVGSGESDLFDGRRPKRVLVKVIGE